MESGRSSDEGQQQPRHHPFPSSMHFSRSRSQSSQPQQQNGMSSDVGGGGDNNMGTFGGHSKVYIGHLSSEVTRENLIDFLIDEGKVAEQSIVKVNVKTGFAFVEFLGLTTADDVVNMCNGKPFMNTVVRVEKAVNSENYAKRASVPNTRRPSYETYGMRYSPSRNNYPMPFYPNPEGIILSRPETAFMYVPDEIVGALIGRKGESIREIIHASGASIKILEGIIYISSYPTRRVVIHGGAQSIFYAENLIFEKVMRDWPCAVEHGEELTVEMTVPTEYVGRLIGKGGANVREIQRQHYCKVKYMTEPDTCIPPPAEGETYVRITGSAYGFGCAQRKVRALLAKVMSRTFSNSLTKQ